MDHLVQKRVYCARCALPQRSCICQYVRAVSHQVRLGILQHPSEQYQAKGTARLAQLCLQDCQLWVGESLADLADLQAWLAAKPTFLLFPTQDAPSLSAADLGAHFMPSEVQVLLLDGTWRKAFRLLQCNPVLQYLPRLTLHTQASSAYHIRKAPHAQSLSTLEAIYYALAEIEGDGTPFEGLRLALADFVAQRQAFSARRLLV